MTIGRKPQTPRWSGQHGGYIERESGPQAVEQQVVRRRGDEQTEINALEAALARTSHGRRLLDLLADAAKWRIHEQLAAELSRGATENLERLRRTLLSTRDPLEQHRVAAQIPEAEAEAVKWQRAHADYQSRREHTEYALRDIMRVFA